ncbi:hypothetical protein NEDG_02051 [Nematocida displodere]|uniref:Uncharacterized protein n=1 Tax=Nematocida displodere TaxID=1805483 RepID=A0A177ELQ0_9MICR|nr:hypothetical protein NEDG_02051 [Nematocida displodere]
MGGFEKIKMRRKVGKTQSLAKAPPQPQADTDQSFDLAVKNTELKEEIKTLKEKQNLLMRESLQHQYLTFKIKSEAEALLAQHMVLLSQLSTTTDESIKALDLLLPTQSPRNSRSPRNPRNLRNSRNSRNPSPSPNTLKTFNFQ